MCVCVCVSRCVCKKKSESESETETETHEREKQLKDRPGQGGTQTESETPQTNCVNNYDATRGTKGTVTRVTKKHNNLSGRFSASTEVSRGRLGHFSGRYSVYLLFTRTNVQILTPEELGSHGRVYILQKKDAFYSCTCPLWRYQAVDGVPKEKRRCVQLVA